jgi:hypothetical protein
VNRDQLALAAAVAALVPATFAASLPTLADLHDSPNTAGMAYGMQAACVQSVVLVAALTAVSGSGAVALVGGVAILSTALLYDRARRA